MKKKTKIKRAPKAVQKEVLIFRGEVGEVVFRANEEINTRGKAWEAKPIEFTRVIGGLQITINFKKNLKGTGKMIQVTQTPQDWDFTLTLNHPVLEIDGTVYYFGIR